MTFGTRLHEFMEAAVETREQRLVRGIETVFEQVHGKWVEANEEVRALFDGKYQVDEVALCFPDREVLAVFLSLAVQRGWVLFNYAEDSVRSRPIPGAYEVEYWFMSSQERQYRLELMVVSEGFSPFHASILEAASHVNAPLSLAHASFKVPDEEALAAVGIRLRKSDFEAAQHCESTYGRFSYYMAPQARALAVLKPRVNLRDNEAATEPDDNRSWLEGGPFPCGGKNGY